MERLFTSASKRERVVGDSGKKLVFVCLALAIALLLFLSLTSSLSFFRNNGAAKSIQTMGVLSTQLELRSGNSSSISSSSISSSSSKRESKLAFSEFVIAIPTSNSHASFILASRIARQGAKTYIAVEKNPDLKDNTDDNEAWAAFPDDKQRRSHYAGDTRAAVVPFLAHQHFGGNFKWMLYGDDDTVFFLKAAANVASGLDHNLPIYLSDNLWYDNWGDINYVHHPHRGAPSCLPCNHTASEKKLQRMGYRVKAACPCTPEALCEGDKNWMWRGCVRQGDYSPHGGAGALLSIGLLRHINYENLLSCIKRTIAPGGDAFLAECLWLQGVGPTTPDPFWHPFRLQMFSPSPVALHTDEYMLFKISHVMAVLLMEAADVCSGLCKLELNNVVSLHIRSRFAGGSVQGSAIFVWAFSILSARADGRLGGSTPSKPEPPFADANSAITTAIEEEIEVSIGNLQKLSHLNKAALTGRQNPEGVRHPEEVLHLKTVAGRVRLFDRVMAATADAVALKILRGIRLKVMFWARPGSELFSVARC